MVNYVLILSGIRCAATRASRKVSRRSRQRKIRPDFHEPSELLRGAEAAQCLQGCDCLRDRWMARDADRGNRSSGFASLRCDYERGSLACDLRISDRADKCVGI